MKTRLTLILAALGAAIPFLVFIGKGKKTDSDGPPAEQPVALVETVPIEQPAVAPPHSASSENAPDPVASRREDDPATSGTVAKAVEVVKQGAAEGPDTPPSTPEETAEPLPEGALSVGRVEGQSKLSPELAELAQKGAVAVTEQRWEEARDLYLEMVRQAPDNALAYANLGVAEHQLGNLLAAAGNLRKSLEINPSIAPNWQTLGLIHFERGELEMAISHLTRAIHEDPSDARSRLYLAAVVREYGWTDAAITELQRAVDTDPELADAHYNLAVTYLDADPPRIELARRHYYSAIDLGAAPSEELEAIFRGDKPE